MLWMPFQKVGKSSDALKHCLCRLLKAEPLCAYINTKAIHYTQTVPGGCVSQIYHLKEDDLHFVCLGSVGQRA